MLLVRASVTSSKASELCNCVVARGVVLLFCVKCLVRLICKVLELRHEEVSRCG